MHRGLPPVQLDAAHPAVAPLVHAETVRQLAELDGLPRGLEGVRCRGCRDLVLASSPLAGTAAVLMLSRRAFVPLTEADRLVLAAAARTLTLVSQNRALSGESERHAAILQSAYAVSRAISRSLDLEQTHDVIAANASRVVRGSRCLLLELERESGDLVAVASSTVGDPDLAGMRIRLDGLQPQQFQRKPVELAIENSVWGSGVSPGLRKRLDMRSVLFVPMVAQNQLVGALLLSFADRRQRFSPRDAELAEEVAEQAAIAIHNARLYRDLAEHRARIESLLSRITRIREHERSNLASIVHDDIVQSMVSATYLLQACRAKARGEWGEQLEETVELLRSAIGDARRVISDLRPPVLNDLGLAAALRELADRADADGPARVGVSLTELPELDPEQATVLYKIAREAVTNAQRHAHAGQIRLTLDRAEAGRQRFARLVVRDDGVGFDSGRARDPEHYGQTLMEEQATLAGGTCRVSSSPGAGTAVEAAIPLPASPHEGRED